jgi:predicted ATPase/class 3 adenylate cyclase/DNA-binding winged helix-turn-helix (wHTH) protein
VSSSDDSRIAIGVLGPIELSRDGMHLSLPSRRRRAILAILCDRIDVAVSFDTIVACVWGEEPPAESLTTLHAHISKLRQVVGKETIETTPVGYRLHRDAVTLDVDEFERRRSAAARAAARGDDGEAANGYESALALWRGPAFAEFAENAELRPSAVRLNELRIGTREHLAEVRIRAGHFRAAIGEVEQLCAECPSRERPHLLLMQALAGEGRARDALQVGQAFRVRLVEDAGLDVSPRLVQLEASIANSTFRADSESHDSDLPSGTVTFLFTDIEHSTARWAEHEDAMRRELRHHDATVESVLGSHHGRLFKHTGDGICAAFERATDAVAASIELQRRLAGSPLRVRVGLHTGEATPERGDYRGPSLNVVARVMRAAPAGHVLMSNATAELVESRVPEDVELLHLGRYPLRGLAEPVRLFELHAPGLEAPFATQSTRGFIGQTRAAPSTSFVGRDRELQAVADALERTAVVSLCGVGGVGKTRLALEVAARAEGFDGGISFAALAPVASDGVVHAVAAAVGAVPRRDQAIEEAIVEQLEGRACLIVLDNCEHCLHTCAELALWLTAALPSVRILATSREPLGVAGEVVHQVRPLAAPKRPESARESAAVALFVDRARAARDDFALGPDNVGAVSDLCSRLDGIPLALEMAAARMRSMSPKDLLARVDERFRLLKGRRGDAEGHHRSLEASVAWSFDLLDHSERCLLERLAIFGGTFDLDAVEAVCHLDEFAPDGIPDQLCALVDKSLVVAEPRDGQLRYRLLETVKAFAAQALDERGDRDRLSLAAAEYLNAWTWRCAQRIRGPEEGRAVSAVNLEFDNLRMVAQSAIGAGRTEIVIDLLEALFDDAIWRDRAECYEWARAAIEHGDDEDPRLAAAYGYIALASPLWSQAQGEAIRKGVALYERAEPDLGPCWPLRLAFVTGIMRFMGDSIQAFADPSHLSATLTSQLRLADEQDSAFAAVYLCCTHSVALVSVGRTDEGREYAHQASRRAASAGAPTALALALASEARLERLTNVGRAEEMLEQALVLASSVESRRLVASVLGTLVDVRARHADPTAAVLWLVGLLDDRRGWASSAEPETILTYVIGLLIRLGARDAAGQMLGAVQGRDDRRIRTAAERLQLEAARDHLARSMDRAHLQRAVDAGRGLSDEALVRLARDAIASVQSR